MIDGPEKINGWIKIVLDDENEKYVSWLAKNFQDEIDKQIKITNLVWKINGFDIALTEVFFWRKEDFSIFKLVFGDEFLSNQVHKKVELTIERTHIS